MDKTVTIPLRQMQMMLLASFRYSLGRTTYMSSVCVEWLQTHWDILPEDYRRQIHGDIKHAIATKSAGHDCDVAEWEKLLALKIGD